MDIQMQELITAYKDKTSTLDHDLMVYKLVTKKQEAKIAELNELVDEIKMEKEEFAKELETLKASLEDN